MEITVRGTAGSRTSSSNTDDGERTLIDLVATGPAYDLALRAANAQRFQTQFQLLLVKVER